MADDGHVAPLRGRGTAGQGGGTESDLILGASRRGCLRTAQARQSRQSAATPLRQAAATPSIVTWMPRGPVWSRRSTAAANALERGIEVPLIALPRRLLQLPFARADEGGRSMRPVDRHRGRFRPRHLARGYVGRRCIGWLVDARKRCARWSFRVARVLARFLGGLQVGFGGTGIGERCHRLRRPCTSGQGGQQAQHSQPCRPGAPASPRLFVGRSERHWIGTHWLNHPGPAFRHDTTMLPGPPGNKSIAAD